MKRRIIKSLINQISRTLIMILIFVLITFSLSFSFLFNDASLKLRNEFTGNIKPLTAIISDSTIINSAVDYTIEKTKSNKTKKEENDYLIDYANDIELADEYFNYDKVNNNLLTTPLLYLIPYSEEQGLLIFDNTNPSDNSNASNELIYSKINKIKNNESTFWTYGYLQSVNNESDLSSYSMLEGNNFTNEELENGDFKIVLTYCDAFYNGVDIKKVEVGDTVTYSLFKKEGDTSEIIRTYEFEIIGIIDEDYNLSNKAFFVNYIPKKCLTKIIEECYPLIEDDLYYFDSYITPVAFTPTIFTLNNLDEINNFIEYYNYLNNTLDKGYSYETDVDKYIKLAGSIESISSSFSSLFIFAIVLSIFTLYFVIMFDVSKRRKEIGTLMSLGESKVNISIEFCLEYCTCLIISLMIVLFFISPVVELVANSLVDLSVNTFVSQNEVLPSVQLSNINFDISLSFKNILKILLIVLSISLPSIISSILYISHFNPKEVLKDE